MDYSELRIVLMDDSDESKNLIIAELYNIGFEGFDEKDNVLTAFYKSNNIESKETIIEIINKYDKVVKDYKFSQIEYKNWNEIWENNFHPVFIDDECVIKASFHDNFPEYKYQIIIDPKMSFGTGHHETTSLIISTILRNDLKGKNIADIGCGTCVLSILSSFKGANKVTAIDIDEWAYTNSVENCKKNDVSNIEILTGDIDIVIDKKFDIILANINRNVLLEHIPSYAKILNKKGKLFLSGIYNSDKEIIFEKAQKVGFECYDIIEKNNWIAISLNKVVD